MFLKEYLILVEQNEKKLFLGGEQGIGKYYNDSFVVILPSMNLEARKWLGTKYPTQLQYTKDYKFKTSVS